MADEQSIAKLWVKKGRRKYLVACLGQSVPNVRLDLAFSLGEKVTFSTEGTNENVYLTGYVIPSDVELGIEHQSDEITHYTTSKTKSNSAIVQSQLSDKIEPNETADEDEESDEDTISNLDEKLVNDNADLFSYPGAMEANPIGSSQLEQQLVLGTSHAQSVQFGNVIPQKHNEVNSAYRCTEYSLVKRFTSQQRFHHSRFF